jgi:Cu/Ag efflux pump CusA
MRWHPARAAGRHGLSLADIVNALEKNNSNQGAGYIERRGEQYLVRAPGQVQSMDDIRDIIVGTAQGLPIRIRDIAASESAASYAPVLPPKTARKSCSARSSCSW